MPKTRLVNATFSHSINAQSKGVELLDYLCIKFPYHRRNEWEERLQKGNLRIDGELPTASLKLLTGMRLEYRMEDYLEPEVPISFHTILKERTLALVHKPPGLPVHKTGKIFINTLSNLFREAVQDSSWAPLHRLDMETSGIVAFARGRENLKKFSPSETNTQWVKLYLAGLVGLIPEQGELSYPLLENLAGPIRSQMLPNSLGKPAKTLFHVLHRHQKNSLVLVRTLTGRKHQIRAHFAAEGFPLIGDKIYSHAGHFYLKRLEGELTEADFQQLGAPYHLLHALYLKIESEDNQGISGWDLTLPPAFLDHFPTMKTDLEFFLKSSAFQNLVRA